LTQVTAIGTIFAMAIRSPRAVGTRAVLAGNAFVLVVLYVWAIYNAFSAPASSEFSLLASVGVAIAGTAAVALIASVSVPVAANILRPADARHPVAVGLATAGGTYLVFAGLGGIAVSTIGLFSTSGVTPGTWGVWLVASLVTVAVCGSLARRAIRRSARSV
jgi:hypothetical protein